VGKAVETNVSEGQKMLVTQREAKISSIKTNNLKIEKNFMVIL